MNLTDTKMLEARIKASGLKMSYLAEQLNLTRQGFWLKVKNRNEFRASEIKRLCELLNITALREREQIFFAPKVEDMATKGV